MDFLKSAAFIAGGFALLVAAIYCLAKTFDTDGGDKGAWMVSALTCLVLGGVALVA